MSPSIQSMRVDQLVARPAHAAARETGPLDERVGDMRSVRGRVLGAAALAPTGERTHAIWRSASRVWLLERTSLPLNTSIFISLPQDARVAAPHTAIAQVASRREWRR